MSTAKRKTLEQLEKERAALKRRLGGNSLFRHNMTGNHYIVLNVVFLHGQSAWGVLYMSASESSDPVPFAREWCEFQAKFTQVPQ